MKRTRIFALATISLIASVLAAVFFVNYFSMGNNSKGEPFFVGVTYGGNNVQDAKTLIDKVANYTNLFVLQSGILKNDASAVNEIGDYAVSKGLHFAAYFDVSSPAQNAMWIGTAKQRWGDMFAGVYFGDEPGGKMLDAHVDFTDMGNSFSPSVTINGTAPDNVIESPTKMLVKNADGSLYTSDGIFYPNGKIIVQKSNDTSSSEPDPNNSSITITNMLSNTNLTTYEPNGSITVRETITKTTTKVYTGGLPYGHHNVGDSYEVLRGNFYTVENGSDLIAQEETYQQVKSKNPIPDCDTAANLYMNKTKEPIDNLRNQWNISMGDFPIFTSDYALYWWDYQSGYDMVLAQLGWNNTVAQEIGLVRGAANLQDKQWGTIITWTYTKPPYLASGDEIYNQMRMSYESGAEYVIIFNYADDMAGPYGTLLEEHFDALERFWNDVVQNPVVAYGGIKAEAAFVLPKNYGWGLRNPQDTVWGLWTPTAEAQQAWPLLQDSLSKHGLQLDIVYDDSTYPVAGKYRQVYYWNQAS